MNVLLSITLLCVVANFPADAINCYQCNSIDNSACFYLEDRGKLIKPTPCNESNYNGPFIENTTNLKPVCRKTVLTYLDFQSGQFRRVVRDCGYTPNNKPCYLGTNDDHEEIVCECNTDGCNGSLGNRPALAFIIISFISSVFVKCVI